MPATPIRPTTPPAPHGRGAQKTIRFAKGSDLLDWYERLAEETEGISTNGALILALEKFRADQEGGAAGDHIRERTA
jgi:hypothetical protein